MQKAYYQYLILIGALQYSNKSECPAQILGKGIGLSGFRVIIADISTLRYLFLKNIFEH